MSTLNLSLDHEPTEQEMRQVPGIYEDFIGSYKNAVSDDLCKEIIEAFDYHLFAGGMRVWQEDTQFAEANAGRFDWAMDLEHIAPRMYDSLDPARQLNDVLVNALENYVHKYGHLKTRSYSTLAQKIQKTPAGGGYHVWHDESGEIGANDRQVVWMVYLNDNFEGGETEFLYYNKRVQPEKGKLILWPAGFTHCHRGGLVTKGNKYVVTGWFHVAEG